MKFVQRYGYVAAYVAIALLVGLRLYSAASFANPLFMDEVTTGAHVRSIIEHGTDANGAPWPLMAGSLGGGYTTAVYLYPLVAWVMLFGDGSVALREFSQVMAMLAVCAVAGGVYFWRGKRAAIVALLAGLSLPWSWVNGMVAWDPAITPLFVALGFLLFSYLVNRQPKRLWQRNLVLGGLTLALVLAAYSYPPARVTAPLLLLGAVAYLLRMQRMSWSSWVTVVGVGAVSSLPLLQFMLSPEALGRSSHLSVFSDSLLGGIELFVVNMAELLGLVGLFISGDPNPRHSPGFMGMLGLAALLPIGYALYRRVRGGVTGQLGRLFHLAWFGIFAGLIGSALTNEGQPHYLRAVAAWPFFVVLITVGWELLLDRKSTLYWITLAIGGVTTAVFIAWMLQGYATYSYEAFESTPTQPGVELDYYNLYYRK